MAQEKPIVDQLSGLYFRQLCDAAGLGLVGLDGDLVVRYCNQGAAAVFDLTPAAMIGTPIGEIVGPQWSNPVERLARRAADYGVTSDFDFRYRPRQGSPRCLALTFSPIPGADDSQGASIAIRDITRRIQLQQQMGQSSKMRALGAMAGNFAHHFNNILGSVVTSVDFAKESNDLRVLHKTLNNTAVALQRATRLLQGLLAFAEADYRDEHYADLSETVFDFVEQIEPELAAANIRLNLNLGRVQVLEVPRNQFLTVLRNVLDNAVEAMPGGGNLGIELVEEEAIICRITDSGPGIMGKNLERVFEPFYSTKRDLSSRNEHQHPGLGLSVAMGIIHELGGEISIDSRPGHYTVVEIRVPLDPARPLHRKPSESGIFDAIDEPQDQV